MILQFDPKRPPAAIDFSTPRKPLPFNDRLARKIEWLQAQDPDADLLEEIEDFVDGLIEGMMIVLKGGA